MGSETKTCQNCKKDFTIEPEDFNFYQKMQVPPPTFCPLCRAQRRFAFRNERTLYKVKSAWSGKEIFSMFSPASGITVYENEVWQGDEWDPMSFGREYDFSKSFFEQFFELVKEVPFRNLNALFTVNSPYTNNISYPKNSYLVFNAKSPEDCMYSHAINDSKWCADCSHVSRCEYCYECFWTTDCSNCTFSSSCESSYNMMFCKNCSCCHDCFGCANLRNASYYIYNKKFSKEGYSEKIKSLQLKSFNNVEKIKKEAEEFWLKFPNKYLQGFQNTKVSGNYIEHSKEVQNSFMVREGQNLHYCQYLQELPGCKDCWDYSIWGDNSQFLYECHASGFGAQNLKFCLFGQEDVRDMEYCIFCTRGSAELFGCVGLKKKQYCILNKQYSKEEYIGLVKKIKKQMDEVPYVDQKGRVYKYGEYFPVELSPFSYNTTMAQEYFPITVKNAEEEGYFWENAAERSYNPDYKHTDLPDDIEAVQDDMSGKVIACAHGGKCNQLCTEAFRIIEDELAFYRKMNLPLPRLCPNCRTFERLKQRTGIDLYKSKCQCAGEYSKNSAYKNTVAHSHGNDSCLNEFETCYAPDRPEIVYCESCYQKEVY